jgi:glycosyltransferase involved in cell wall biosynthesis
VETVGLAGGIANRALRLALTAILLIAGSDRAFSMKSGCRPRRLRRLRDRRFDVIIANDLQCLPWVRRHLAASRRLVLDAHEFKEEEFSERLLWRLLARPVVRRIARRHLPDVDAITTVSAGIAGLFRDHHGVQSTIVMNAPARADLEPQSVASDAVRLVHVGGYRQGRGLETLVEALEILGDRFTLDFFLLPRPGLAAFRERCAPNPRVTFHEPVPMARLPETLNRFDIGVYALPPRNANNQFALPNKFFEFIQSRIAIAIGPSPDMARLVREFECGVVAADFSAAALAAVLSGLDGPAIERMKAGSHRAAEQLNAEASAETIRRIVLERNEKQ